MILCRLPFNCLPPPSLQSGYSLFDPREGYDWSSSSHSLAEVERMEEDLLADLVALLDRASYKPLRKAEQELALRQQYSLTVPVAVDDDKVRGRGATHVSTHHCSPGLGEMQASEQRRAGAGSEAAVLVDRACGSGRRLSEG